MNSGQLWNSHQRLKFLRDEVPRDILKFRVSEMAFPEVFKRDFPSRTPSFQDIAQFKRFTDHMRRVLAFAFPSSFLIINNSIIAFFFCFCLITSFLSSFSLSLIVSLIGRNNLATITNKGKIILIQLVKIEIH